MRYGPPMTNRKFAVGAVIALAIGGLFAYGRWFSGGTPTRQEDPAADLKSQARYLQIELDACRTDIDTLRRKLRTCEDDCDE